jgi:hypothetical protein
VLGYFISMSFLYIFLYALYGCVLFRFRGGMFGDLIKRFLPFWGTTLTRITFSLLLLLPFVYELGWYYFLAVGGLYLGCIIRLYPWQYQKAQPIDFIQLSFRGLLYSFPFMLIDTNSFIGLAGITQGFWYYLGTFFPIWHEQWPWQETSYEMVNSDWGEYMFGAWLGFILGLAWVL